MDHVRKSISADVNYGIRFTNDLEMFKFVQELSVEVSKRMEEIHVSYKEVMLYQVKLVEIYLTIRSEDDW